MGGIYREREMGERERESEREMEMGEREGAVIHMYHKQKDKT